MKTLEIKKRNIILVFDSITLTHQTPLPPFAQRQNKIRKIESAIK